MPHDDYTLATFLLPSVECARYIAYRRNCGVRTFFFVVVEKNWLLTT